MDFNNFLFRASSIGELMTPPKGKADKEAGNLGATCTSKLKSIYREVTWKRKQELSNKYIQKGVECEENAITLLSRVKKTIFFKNKERINNDFLTGEPDLFKGESICKAEEGFDTKCSWSWATFPFPGDPLESGYYWQDMSYMALTGAKAWTTSYCLVNTPAHLIDDQKRRFLLNNNLSEFDETYLEECKKIERNSIYDLGEFMKELPHYDLVTQDWEYDIPMKERVIEFRVERDEEVIQSIYNNVPKWRAYLNSMNLSVLLASYDHSVKATIIEN